MRRQQRVLRGHVHRRPVSVAVQSERRGVLVPFGLLRRPVQERRVHLRGGRRALLELVGVLLEAVRERALRRWQRELRGARAQLRGEQRVLSGLDVRGQRVSLGDVRAARRLMRQPRRLLSGRVRGGAVPAGGVRGELGGVHARLRVLRGVLQRRDVHVPGAMPAAQRVVLLADGVLRGHHVCDGRLPRLGLLPGDERAVHQWAGVLLRRVQRRAVRRGDVSAGQWAVSEPCAVLLAAVQRRALSLSAGARRP